MAYSVDFRGRVLEYIEEGHTQAQAQEVFKVSITAIKGWKKLKAETGEVEKRPLHRQPRIYDAAKLETYIEEHPQAILKEIAEHFGGSISGADNALKRAHITLKKRHQGIGNVMKRKELNTIKHSLK